MSVTKTADDKKNPRTFCENSNLICLTDRNIPAKSSISPVDQHLSPTSHRTLGWSKWWDVKNRQQRGPMKNDCGGGDDKEISQFYLNLYKHFYILILQYMWLYQIPAAGLHFINFYWVLILFFWPVPSSEQSPQNTTQMTRWWSSRFPRTEVTVNGRYLLDLTFIIHQANSHLALQ